jgi:hypothetical protein
MTRVNPLYYVTFTTATLCASFILFRGFNTTDPVNTISLLCGFLIIFAGVYLLNLSREDPDGRHLLGQPSPGLGLHGFEDAIPTDSLTAFGTRRSMQARRSSTETPRGGHSRRVSWGSSQGRNSMSRDGLMDGFGLDNLAEDSEEEDNIKKQTEDEESLIASRLNGQARLSGSGRVRSGVERETVRPSKGTGRGS